MKRLVLILLLCAAALPAAARDFELGMRHIVAKPGGDNGALDVAMSRGFAATAEVFWTEHLSTQAAASFVNPEASQGEVDLGTIGLDMYSLTARWHFAPGRRVSAYAGGGAVLVQIGNLDDQFGDAIEAEYGSETTFLAEAGIRYRLLPRLFLDAGVSYMPLRADAETRRGDVPAEVDLDHMFVTIGAGWRF